MVSRRTCGYREKKPMAAFGQFMLPLAVIMAIALLYFSVKLFFLTPSRNEAQRSAPPVAAGISSDTPAPAQVLPVREVSRANTAPAPAQSAQPKVIAGPVTARPSVMEQRPQQGGGSAAPAVKPAAPKQEPAPAQSSQKTAVLRYDVQIGAFASRDNALQLVQKARAQGHDVYINEALYNGAPYFRVRVKGPAERAPSQALSVKLQEQGYPVYIVQITK